jgi:hypothetical protein
MSFAGSDASCLQMIAIRNPRNANALAEGSIEDALTAAKSLIII